MEKNIIKRSLYDILSQYKVAELKMLYSHLGLKIKSGVKKDVMIRSLQKYLVDNPDYLIKHLLTYELRMYNDLVNHPEKGLQLPPELNRFPIDSVAFGDDGYYHCLAPELEPVMQPLLEDAIRQREESGEEKVENHIVGLLNLRGAIPSEEYISILQDGGLGVESENDVFIRFHRFYAGNDQDDDTIVESPFVFGTEFNAFDWRCVDRKTEPKQFSDAEIAKAAIMPYPQIGGKAYEKLKKTLLGFGKTESQVDEYILERWLHKQNDTTNPIDGLDSIKYDSYEQVQELLPALTDYANKVPYWKFKGWSSEETSERERKLHPNRPLHITMGPNMRARGIHSFEQLQEMAAKGEEIPDMPFPGMAFQDPYVRSDKKVGRNDPCPCGSGKKYKNCCGR